MARPRTRASPHPLTPPLTFYLGLSLFLLSTPLIPHFSIHLHHWASQAMLTYSFPRHHVNLTSSPPSITTFRSHYKPHASSVSSEQEALSMASKWAQRTVVIPAQRRGCHLVTSKIVRDIEQDLSGFKCGLAHFFLHHTSASLTINENYDSDVQEDTENFLNRIVPEGRSAPWKHTLEGPDDMPAHIKSSMFGCSLTIPITDGRLNMGTWQGIWLCEHRDHATPRKIVITMNGM